MEFKDFFETIDIEKDLRYSGLHDEQLGQLVHFLKPGEDPLEEGRFDLAIIGVPEARGNMDNEGSRKGPDAFRQAFYRLYGHHKAKLVDLGDLRPGHSLHDTYVALSSVTTALMKKNITPIIIGGSPDLTYSNFLAYENMEQIINLVSIDSRIHMGRGEEEITATNYLSKIILKQPNFLFNYSNIGYQTYLVDKDELDLLDNLSFDAIRLGESREQLRHNEPLIRNADVISFNMAAIRLSEAPGVTQGSPNGYFGDEACQLVRYAGMSDKLTSIGFYGLSPEQDQNNITSALLAQMIWYFMDGYYSRKNDFPKCNISEYVKYNVNISEEGNELVFYKSNKSGRWWMEIPYPFDNRLKFSRHLLTPCTYEDYETAMKNEVPDRWLKTYKKLS